VTSDHRLFDLFDDLEGQAEALFLAERDAELADRSRAEYASVSLASRLMASEGQAVTVAVTGVGRLHGQLARVAAGWLLVAIDADEWLVPLDAVEWAEGLSGRAVPEQAWPAFARLGLGSALRRLADDDVPCVLVTRSGTRHEVVIRRVGADFVETDAARHEPVRIVVPLAAIGGVQRRCGA
jgi:hypothetical protein